MNNMKIHKKKKFFALILSFLILMTCIPVDYVFAGNPYDVVINEENFPDEAFRNYVKFWDKDNNGILSSKELQFVESINIPGGWVNDSGQNVKIKDLTGIDEFPNLKRLNCSNNELTELPLFILPYLEELDCSENQITELVFSDWRTLKKLNCSKNKLTNLNTENLINIEELKCDYNELETLNVAPLNNITHLYCSHNHLTSLDLSSCNSLEYYKGIFQYYDIDVDVNGRTFDLSTLPGEFDVNKIEEWRLNKPTVSGSTMTVPTNMYENGEIIYDYDTSQRDYYNNELLTLNVHLRVNFTGTPNEYDINLTSNGNGNVSANFTKAKAGEKVTLTVEPLPGYHLNSFDKSPSDLSIKDVTVFDYSFIMPRRDVSITANFDSNPKVTVKFDSNGGSGTMADLAVNQGSTYKLPECDFTAPDGKEFDSWEVNGKEKGVGATIIVDADTTVKALWKDKPVIPQQVTITFDSNGGSGTMADVTIDKGSTYTLPVCDFTAPDGKEFDSWEVGGVRKGVGATIIVDADTTVKALWKDKPVIPQQVTITFDSNGDSGTMADVTIDKGSTYTLPVCNFTAPEEKEFKAWIVGGEEKAPNDTVIVNADTTVTALWKVIDKTALENAIENAKNALAGISPSDETDPENIESGKKVAPQNAIDALEQAIEDAQGIYDKATATQTEIDSEVAKLNAARITFEAAIVTGTKVEAIDEKFTVSFDANGGSGAMADVEVNKGDNFTLPDATFTAPDGKEFDAWEVNGARKTAGSTITVTEDIVVTALWKDEGSSTPGGEIETPHEERHTHKNYRKVRFNLDDVAEKDPQPKAEPVISCSIFKIGEKFYTNEVKGVRTTKDMDVAPYIKDDRTMVPIRFAAEAFGFKVEWNKEARKAILIGDNYVVEIPVDTDIIVVNGVEYHTDVKAVIEGDRTFIPVANLARALGLKDGEDIIWNEVTKTVMIIKDISDMK
jgi:hypothetical protein